MIATGSGGIGRAALLALAVTGGVAVADEQEDRVPLTIVGRSERVAIVDGGVVMEAKVDTGADSTSIDARNQERFERDEDEWVRFEVRTNEGQVVTFERRIADTVTIIGAGDEKQERLVVEITLCVSDVSDVVEVNLADRTGLDYRLLLGREFLARNGFLVNVAQAYSHEPRCEDTVER